jgi:hypothetical protein
MPLEQIVEQDRVVCSVCVGHKTKFSDAEQVNSPGGAMSLLSLLLSLSRLMFCRVQAVGCDGPEVDEPYKYLSYNCIFPKEICLVVAS